jgi:hypothetical protein
MLLVEKSGREMAVLMSHEHYTYLQALEDRWWGEHRVIQLSMEQLTEGVGGTIKRFDPREGLCGKACPHTSQNAWMELLPWYYRHVR